MTHAYHPQCGCDSCGRADEAAEERDAYIADFSPAVAKRLVGWGDFAINALLDLSPEAKDAILQDVGRFFTRFHNTSGTDALAAIGVDLWRELRPTIEAAAQDQAESDMAAEYDRSAAA